MGEVFQNNFFVFSVFEVERYNKAIDSNDLVKLVNNGFFLNHALATGHFFPTFKHACSSLPYQFIWIRCKILLNFNKISITFRVLLC